MDGGRLFFFVIFFKCRSLAFCIMVFAVFLCAFHHKLLATNVEGKAGAATGSLGAKQRTLVTARRYYGQTWACFLPGTMRFPIGCLPACCVAAPVPCHSCCSCRFIGILRNVLLYDMMIRFVLLSARSDVFYPLRHAPRTLYPICICVPGLLAWFFVSSFFSLVF